MLQYSQCVGTTSFLFTLKSETEKAIQVKNKGGTYWLPKSQVTIEKKDKKLLVSIPEWMIEVKGIIQDIVTLPKARTLKEKELSIEKRTAKQQAASKSENTNSFVGFFDGAITVNPNGVMGWGAAIFKDGKFMKECTGGLKANDGNTNNIAEYNGLLALLVMAENSGIDDLLIYGDNEMVIRQAGCKMKIKNGGYTAIAALVVKKIREMKLNGMCIVLKWIPREENAYADILSKKFSQSIAK